MSRMLAPKARHPLQGRTTLMRMLAPKACPFDEGRTTLAPPPPPPTVITKREPQPLTSL